VVREGGVEPPCPFGHTDLNRARLHIPPLARVTPRPGAAFEDRRPCQHSPLFGGLFSSLAAYPTLAKALRRLEFL